MRMSNHDPLSTPSCAIHSQAICVTTIGSKMDAMKTDSMRGESSPEEGRFYLHYHFPPSSVGEIGKTGMAGEQCCGARRELQWSPRLCLA